MHEVDLDRAQREEVRWRILRALDAGRPSPVAETVIYRALADIDIPLSPKGLRRELGYLADRDLVELLNTQEPTWSARLTRWGVDFVEYTIEAQPGIARPPKWY